jgi:hypothetical protein
VVVARNFLIIHHQGTSMEFFFYPADENQFKQAAVGNFVRTLVFDTNKDEVVVTFVRRVSKAWEQSCKNNIETDHRIRALSGEHFQIYSWVVKSKNDFSLPGFGVIR